MKWSTVKKIICNEPIYLVFTCKEREQFNAVHIIIIIGETGVGSKGKTEFNSTEEQSWLSGLVRGFLSERSPV